MLPPCWGSTHEAQRLCSASDEYAQAEMLWSVCDERVLSLPAHASCEIPEQSHTL